MYKYITIITSTLLIQSNVLAEPLPEYWSQHNQEHYESGRDYNIKKNGSYSAYITSRTTTPKGSGEVWQAVGDCYFPNNKAKLSVFLKTSNVTGVAGVIFKIVTPTQIIQDRMKSRELSGNNSWKKYYSIMKIPSDCIQMSIGFSLEGMGTVYADDFKISKAKSNSEESSSVEVFENIRTKLENLGFEN